MTGVKINGVTLHSSYSPENEARRYLDTLNLRKGKGVYILLEPGLGYISQELKKRSPESIVLELHCSGIFVESHVSDPDGSWFPESGIPLNTFLHEHISDFSLGLVNILEWPPGGRAFGDIYRRIRERLLIYLRERRASLHTTGFFGKKWTGNSVKRILSTKNYLRLEEESRPVLICAGGPSLEKILSVPMKLRRKISLWALPSALKALGFAGITPDFVVHSDAGYYASHHLRMLQGEAIRQIAPLFSSLPPEQKNGVLLLNTGSPIEDYLIQKAGLPSAKAMSHGTVAGTALAAAENLTTGPIIFAGLDLAFDDVRSHVRPHTFDDIFLSSNNRKKPLLDILYRRAPRSLPAGPQDSPAARDQSFALKRYGEWFASLPAAEGPALEVRRVYRLFPGYVKIPAFSNLSGFKELEDLLENSPDRKGRMETVRIDSGLRREAVFSYLKKIKEENILVREAEKGDDFVEMLSNYPMLEEFLSFCCYAELISLVQRGGGSRDREGIQKIVDHAASFAERLKKITETGRD